VSDFEKSKAFKFSPSNEIIKKSIGWSTKSWFYPLDKVFKEFTLPKKIKVLELGAGEYSATSLLLINKNSQLDITTNEESNIKKIKSLIEDIKDIDELRKNITISQMSAKKISGYYDVIIMKSVLGGIFRLNISENNDADNLLKHICQNHLNENGILISMDNGKTVFESLFSNFGARKNNWRYFLPSDFSNADKQFFFGFLSNFSFVTRFGEVGHLFDNTIFIIDKFIFRNFKIKKPSIIISVYKNKF